MAAARSLVIAGRPLQLHGRVRGLLELSAMRRRLLVTCGLLWIGCGRAISHDAGPDLQILGESSRVRVEDPVPRSSPWFDGARVTLEGARGETLGIQVVHRGAGAATLVIDGALVRGYAVDSFSVRRRSTAMYGGSHGAGRYADGLTPSAAPSTNPAYFAIAIPPEAASGVHAGVLVIGERRIPVALTVARVTLPAAAPRVWAYADPRELAWAGLPADGAVGEPPRATPTAAERACIDVFHAHGVALSPDLRLAWWPERRALLAGVRDIPVALPEDPDAAAEEVRGWITATRGTGQVPFAIPIDEPHTPAQRARVVALATAVRAAGGGPSTFRFAVTDAPRAEYGDLVDLYIQLAPRRGDGHWTYNGAPPRAGAMVLDAVPPGTRTWGWIAWRYAIPIWYVWDALYWHDRHNRRGAPLPGRALEPTVDPTSFDAGEDHGNLDGVLALPSPTGCRPTLRLAALHRGQQDHALLDLAAACDPDTTARLARAMIPRALGDAPRQGAPAWPTDEAAWELARRELLRIASCR